MQGRIGIVVVAFCATGATACYHGVDDGRPGASAEEGGTGATEGDGSEGEGGTGNDDDGDIPDADLEPAPPTIHRLTSMQLHNTWVDVLGEPLDLPTELPADDLLYGFTSIAAAGSTISPLAAEQYENATYFVLDQVWADPVRRAALVGCEPLGADDPCVASFFETFAKKAWRRPAGADEVDALVVLTEELAGDLGDVNAALKYGAASVLQSPNFLFRVEVGEPDENVPSLLRFTSWEMASRLSYLILASPPDAKLIELAEADDLQSRDRIEAQARRLLDDPRARPALVGFFRDFTNIAKLDTLDKSAEQFPQMSATMGVSMRLELEKVFESTVFDGSGDVRDLFTSKKSFVNEDLARVYEIDGITGEELVPHTFADGSHRAGILTSAGFLAVNSAKTETSPTHRGRFVRIQLLCQDVPAPPAGVDTSLPESDPTQPTTLRERLEAHRDQPACAGCHQLMDPIGFAFENYDAIGAWRTEDDNGLPIDAVTEVDSETVRNGIEMGQLVAALPEVGACVAQRFYEHAGAHLVEKGEEDTVDELVEKFVASDYNFRTLVVQLVVNDGFRYASAEVGE